MIDKFDDDILGLIKGHLNGFELLPLRATSKFFKARVSQDDLIKKLAHT